MPTPYADFFRSVTGNPILPYQQRYGKNPFSNTLMVVPTGLGKTDSVLLPWLYAQRRADTAAPTRLIIVLPRQNLTIQTAKNARKRVSAAGLTDKVRVLELMEGSKDNSEDPSLRPDHPAIIVCTQDMYFSRALNRGYARRPPRWPIDFALYNQDCLIVLDEIQLMDDALATSTQLASFRGQFGTYGDAPSIWMSATVNHAWLQTVDTTGIPPLVGLDDDDLATPIAAKRYRAAKRLTAAPPECRDPKDCAAFAYKRHQPGTRSLIIANTVPRAREIFSALREQFPGALLLHSRFRPSDRKRAADLLVDSIPQEGQIVVSTQVLEAGVDITARLLVTDVAPWGSLVQRFGRVNRYGDDEGAEIWWVDEPGYSKQPKNSTLPYSPDEVQRASTRLALLKSAALADLPPEDGPAPWNNVLRRADLLDLFDTTPDLTGNELDVSRFIRDTDDRNAYLAWRDWEGDSEPPPSTPELEDQELCPVSLGDLREFMKKHPVYVWNFATEKWSEADRDKLFAGMLAITRAKEGGYTAAEGWSPESKVKVEPLAGGKDETEGDSSDKRSYVQYRQTLVAHTARVMEETEVLLESINIEPRHVEALRTAATRHDWGKAHLVFQKTLHRNDPSTDLLAKQLKANADRGHERKHFRHELASALAMLKSGDSDLATYLVAAHHGKIRLGIRSMPGEMEVDRIPTARGIREGDTLPACELAPGIFVPTVELSLMSMEFGAKGGSWTDRMLQLRDDIGPFRLAYLEMLLRMADETASANPGPEVIQCSN